MQFQPLTTLTQPVLRLLLAESIDYAGLFPPANLAMEQVVRQYRTYREGNDSWALGRIVIPANRLDEFGQRLQSEGMAESETWLISALLGPDPLADLDRIEQFNAAHSSVSRIDSCEGRLVETDQIKAAAGRCGAAIALYCELPLDKNLDVPLNVIKAAGVRAKMRMGGVTPELFPQPESVIHFLSSVVTTGVPFKATAGLHHPLRSEYPLTYESHAPRGTMYGFLNLMFATTAILSGASRDVSTGILLEENQSAFQFNEEGVRWESTQLCPDHLHRVRDMFCGFGSCSFREPIDELRAAGFLS